MPGESAKLEELFMSVKKIFLIICNSSMQKPLEIDDSSGFITGSG